MIFFTDSNGQIIEKIGETVYQGSANAQRINLFAPLDASLSATVAFQLPNGVAIAENVMTPVPVNSNQIDGRDLTVFSAWEYPIPKEVTNIYGTVTAQFFFYVSGSTVPEIVASSSTTFQVGRGVVTALPSTPTQTIYERILSNFQDLNRRILNGEFTARSFFAWRAAPMEYNVNEIVYFPVGVYGSFVKSIRKNSGMKPYNDTGKLNDVYWVEVLNCNKIIESAAAEAERAHQEAERAKGYADDAAMAGTDVSALVEQAQQAVTDAEAQATQARQHADDAKTEADDARFNAADAANSAQQSSQQAEYALNHAADAQAEANRSKAEADRAKQIADGLTGGLIPKGNSTYEALPSQPSKSNLGWFWNITNDFTTDDRFVEGAGKKVPAGTDVMVIESSVGVFKYNLATGLIDLSDYAEKKYVDDTFVKISSQQEIVHGTDGIGRETQIQYNETPYGSGLAQRTSDGRLKANAPRENNDVVTKESLATNLPIASATQLGGIKIGTGLEVGADGVVNAKGGEAITAEEYQSLFEPKVV